jgi:hypothetical protein
LWSNWCCQCPNYIQCVMMTVTMTMYLLDCFYCYLCIFYSFKKQFTKKQHAVLRQQQPQTSCVWESLDGGCFNLLLSHLSFGPGSSRGCHIGTTIESRLAVGHTVQVSASASGCHTAESPNEAHPRTGSAHCCLLGYLSLAQP